MLVRTLLSFALSAALCSGQIVFQGEKGPGRGKFIVLVSGDDEYRSEEALPQLARILAKRHGFRCAVLFPIDPSDGTIRPDFQTNIPGLEALDSADLMIIATRFRDLPDEQVQHIARYVESGKPIIGLRTATHAFALQSSSTYARYSWNDKTTGGFGREVLGETWIRHHGEHGVQSTRGIIAPEAARHPILRGIRSGDLWSPTDVYETRVPLPDSVPLVLGQVTISWRWKNASASPRATPIRQVSAFCALSTLRQEKLFGRFRSLVRRALRPGRGFSPRREE
jgi:hypothetical protein